jgi:uncharacterized damage-inducible protein DinB
MTGDFMTPEELLQRFASGAVALQTCVQRVSPEKWSETPVAGRWSIAQVVCHLADFEVIYATRIKQVLAEDNPALPGVSEELFAARLHYSQRSVSDELQLITLQRRQLCTILQSADLEDYQRTGVHTEAGPVTLETLLETTTEHLEHHLKFVAEKVAILNGDS